MPEPSGSQRVRLFPSRICRGFAPSGSISHSVLAFGDCAGGRVNAMVLPSGDHCGYVSSNFGSEVSCTVVPDWMSPCQQEHRSRDPREALAPLGSGSGAPCLQRSLQKTAEVQAKLAHVLAEMRLSSGLPATYSITRKSIPVSCTMSC